MTRHASRHANSVTRKSNRSLNSNHTRNPWSAEHQLSGGNAQSSSNSSQTRGPIYRTLSGPGPPPYGVDNVSEVLQQQEQQQQHQQHHPPRHYYQHPQWTAHSAYSGSVTMPRLKSQKVYTNPYGKHTGVAPAPVIVAPSYRSTCSAASANTAAIHKHRSKLCDPISAAVNSGCSTSRTSSDRPATPHSLSTTDGIIDPCGGHCRTFERCCHYLLQVLFVVGILVGVSLVLAVYWLHNQRRSGDKLVLVYIGVLMALVCILLLSIQCSAEREVKRKKRSKRATAALVSRNRNNLEVPMRTLNGSRYVCASREAEENIAGPHTYCEMPLLYNPYYYETQTRSCDEMSQSQNGTFWWRRYGMEVTSKNDNIV